MVFKNDYKEPKKNPFGFCYKLLCFSTFLGSKAKNKNLWGLRNKTSILYPLWQIPFSLFDPKTRSPLPPPPFTKGKTMALSNNVIGAISFVAMLLSIPILAAGIWLSNQPADSCLKILLWPVITLGVLILVMALAGFVGAFWRIPWLLMAYLVGMLVLIILLACLVVFMFMVTIRGSGHIVPNRAYLEYQLEDFSAWLQRRVRASYKWERIETCLSSTQICPNLNQSYTMAMGFFRAYLTPIEVNPPTLSVFFLNCRFNFIKGPRTSKYFNQILKVSNIISTASFPLA